MRAGLSCSRSPLRNQNKIICLFNSKMSNLQAHFLDSVAEDQESSNTKAFEEETLTPLPMPSNGLAVPLGAAESSRPTPMPGRKLSFSRRPSFGLPALAAQHHASSQSLSGGSASRINLASSAHSLGLSQQLLQKESASLKPETGTLKPEMDPSSSASSRKGVINMDEKPETPKAAIMSSPKETTKDALEASRQRHSKKYNLPVSDRFFIAKNPKGMNACVGCYDPYPISWPTKQDVKNQRALAKKKDVDDWNKMVDRFPDKKPTHPLGPGTYQPSFDYVQTHGILNVGGVSFKSTDDRFRKAFKAVEGNPNVGPGVYAVINMN